MRARSLTLIIVLAAALAPPTGAASAVRYFSMQSRSAFLSGTLEGIAVDPLGTLVLADRGERIAGSEEPFLFAGAAHPEGWVVGTGNGGKVLLVGRDGEVRTLYAAAEPEIFAVWADPDGTVFAGSSPGGRVYRIRGDAAEVYFEPGEEYIWDLARAVDGALLVATGTEGRLYRVTGSGEGELLFDSDDTHLRALQVMPDGRILAGTAGEGLVLRIAPDGGARTLYDAEQPEVVDITLAPDGTAYAAALASEASLMDLSSRTSQQVDDGGPGDDAGSEGGGSVRVTVSSGPAEPVSGSRPRGFQGTRSLLLSISPAGIVEALHDLDEETVYSLRWHRDRLWIGTGLEGKLFSFRDRRLVLEKDVEERQVVALLDDRPGPAFLTTNAGALYRISSQRELAGTYTSPALDAEQLSKFGTLRWRGASSDAGQVRFSFRSGVSPRPDRTWSEWSEPRSGTELSLDEVPVGRYLQWRAELDAGGGSGRGPEIGQVEVSYRQINLPPRILSFEALDPGEIELPAGFNPANQIFEPAHPNRQGIFRTLEPASSRNDRRTKTLWKRGFRTLTWEAEDPNDDELVYELHFRPEGGGEWLPMVDELDDASWGFDATALPDGLYRFRLRAADRSDGDSEQALVAEQVSDVVLVDHGAPTVQAVRARDGGLAVEAADALNPLREAKVSVDAGDWRPARAADGLLDGRRETLWVDVPSDARIVLLRLTDAAFNVVTIDLLRESR